MSLFLRKACQKNLDGVGLQNYHIQVDDTSKCLLIVGECGDVLVSIAGIRLSRMAPGDKEIELAIELFDDFLAKHAGTFKEFIAVKIRADKSKIPFVVPGLLDCVVQKIGYKNYWQLSFCMKSEPSVSVNVKSDGSFFINSFSTNLVTDPDDNIQLSLSSTESNAVRKWIKSCNEYHIATEEKTKLLEILSTCEI